MKYINSLVYSRTSPTDTKIILRLFLFVIGIFISTCGYWLLVTAMGVVIYAETRDAFLLTLVTTAEVLPMLFLSPYAGVLADRYNRRVILAIIVMLMVMVVAALAVISAMGLMTTVIFLIATLLLGILYTFDWPARSAILPNLVRTEQISRAVAFGNTAYILARIIGPGMAGMLMGTGGVTLTLIISAVCFAGLIIVLPIAKPIKGLSAENPLLREETISVSQKDKKPTFKEGLIYASKSPLLQVLLGIAIVAGTFGWVPLTLMPAIAKDLVGTDPIGLGWLMSAGGIGSLIGTVLLASGILKISRVPVLFAGLVVLSIAVTAVGFSSNLFLTMFIVAFVGMSMSTTYTSASGQIQRILDDRYRGRVVGILAVAMSLGPLPYMLFGWIANVSGLTAALAAAGAMTLATSALLLVVTSWQKRVRNRAESLNDILT